jgi:copper chaperone CopZ
MRKAILLAMALPMMLVGSAFACTVSDAHFSGNFDDSGRFVIEGALDSAGQPMQGVSGMVLTSVTAVDGSALPTSGMIWAMGDLNVEKGTALVKSFTASADEAAAVVASLHGASYAAAGSGCSSTKAASAGCTTKAASAGCAGKAAASAASAGSCGSKSTAAAASAGSCGSKIDAASASTGACASKAAAATASAGSCDGKAAAATASAGSCGAKSTAASASAGAKEGCCPGGAAATTAATAASSEGACGDGCTKPCCAAHAYTYTVANMTCGACASKVEGAVKAMENSKVAGCWVDLEKGTAVVTSQDELDAAAIAAAITKAGFPAEQVVEKDEKKADVEETAATM